MSKRKNSTSDGPAAKKAKQMATVDIEQVKANVEKIWNESITPSLSAYIEIPNQSPAYDTEWATNGLQEKAVKLLVEWVEGQAVEGLALEVISKDGRTPLIFMEIPSTGVDSTVMLYGHLDKQPPLTDDWDEGLHPYKPVIRDGKLYGRGGADDGYATYCAVTAVKELKKAGVPHPRYVIMVEACEESGSNDLPLYCEELKERIGTPDLVVCLDSGAGNYDQMWLTTSLRGCLMCNVTVKVVTEGVHSGAATGIIPSSFRIIRQLLSRLEDEATGKILGDAFYCEIPEPRLQQAAATAEILGDTIHSEYPFNAGARPISEDNCELYLNNTWRPALAVTGVAGIPTPAMGGNVLRPFTTLKLSLRLPPNVDTAVAADYLKKLMTEDVPYGAEVTVSDMFDMGGWEAPAEAPWLTEACHQASTSYFGKEAAFMGEGGSIPFMGMLGEKFPKAQFLITGVLGPKSNAHGPNEFIDLEYAKKLTCCVVSVLASQASRT